MYLERYFGRIQKILETRSEITIEHFQAIETQPDQEGLIEGKLRFWDGSLLAFVEIVEERGVTLRKVDYAYHYQTASNQLIFRYDNAPHHPEISTHPHHKHTATGLEATKPPHLNDILGEIDALLYPTE